MIEFQRREPFADRPARAAGILDNDGWRLKRYDITRDGAPIDDSVYGPGVALAVDALPRPAVTRDRPGVGVLIRHSGCSAHYVVVAWWDNQNELLHRVFIRDVGSGASWADAGGRYSFCVWDMQVLWQERCAFVRHVLSPAGGPDRAAYLADVP